PEKWEAAKRKICDILIEKAKQRAMIPYSELVGRVNSVAFNLVAVLFCVGLLAVGWAIENPSVSAQPDDKDKGKKPAFRTGAVRYQVKDVDKSVTFYTKHLGFKVELAAPAFA